MVPLLPAPGEAATLRVPSEFSTINAGLEAAASGDTVLVAPGTYTDASPMRVWNGSSYFTVFTCALLNDGVVLRSEAGPEVTTIDMGGQEQGMSFPVACYGFQTVTTSLEGFAIRGSPFGFAAVWVRYCEDLTVRNCEFEDLDGGADYAGGVSSVHSSLRVHDSSFARCRGVQGGAIHHNSRALTIERCIFRECSSSAVYARHLFDPYTGRQVIRDCLFEDNAGEAGAGLLLEDWDRVTVEGCVFRSNVAELGGGALHVSGGGGSNGSVIRRNLFVDNSFAYAAGTGAGLEWTDSGGVLEDNVFSRCTGSPGAPGTAVSLKPDEGIHVTVRRNAIVGTRGAAAIAVAGSRTDRVTSECNLFWDNIGGNSFNYPLGANDWTSDPQLCARGFGSLDVRSTSPCLPANNACGAVIGGAEIGCAADPIVLHMRSWGDVKSLYRR